jgi:hypothetical protein
MMAFLLLIVVAVARTLVGEDCRIGAATAAAPAAGSIFFAIFATGASPLAVRNLAELPSRYIYIYILSLSLLLTSSIESACIAFPLHRIRRSVDAQQQQNPAAQRGSSTAIRVALSPSHFHARSITGWDIATSNCCDMLPSSESLREPKPLLMTRSPLHTGGHSLARPPRPNRICFPGGKPAAPPAISSDVAIIGETDESLNVGLSTASRKPAASGGVNQNQSLESLLLSGFETAEAPQKDKGSILGFRPTKCDAKAKLQSSAYDGSLEHCAVVNPCIASLSKTIGAEIKRAASGDRRSYGSTELSGEIEHYFDVDVHYRDTSSGYSRRDTFFVEKSSMDGCSETSTDSFPCWAPLSSGKMPSLWSLDILKPEANDSRMVWSKDEKRAMDSEFFFEEAEGPEKGEGSAAGFRATKCDAEEQLQFRGNDGRLVDNGRPIVDHTLLSGEYKAEVLSSPQNGSSQKKLWTFEGSGECDKRADVNYRDRSLDRSSQGAGIVDAWYPIVDVLRRHWASFSLGVLFASSEAPSLHCFDTSKPAVDDSRAMRPGYERGAMTTSFPGGVETAEGPKKENGVSSGFQATKSAARGELSLKRISTLLGGLIFFGLLLYWKGADRSFWPLRRRGRVQDHDEAPPAVDGSEGERSDLHGDTRASPLPATERQQLERCDHNNKDGGGSTEKGGAAALAGVLTFLFVCSLVYGSPELREFFPLFYFPFLFLFSSLFFEDEKCAKRWRKRRSADLFYLTLVVLSFVVMPMASAVATADASARAEGLNGRGPKAGRFGNDLLAAPPRKVIQPENSGGRDSGAASNGFVMLRESPRPRAVRRSEPKPKPPPPPPPPPPPSDNATNAVAASSPSTDLVAATAATSEAATIAQKVARGFMTVTSRRLTTVVTTEEELEDAIADNAYIMLGNEITLSAAGSTGSAFTINGVTGWLTIDGAGYTLGFASSSSANGRIFYIDGGSSVEMVDLTLANGYVYTTSGTAAGGAISLTGSSTLEMISCTLSGNTAFVS